MYDPSESIPVRNTLSSFRDYSYRGVQRTDRELCHDTRHNHPRLNIGKTNELVVNYRRKRRPSVLVDKFPVV